jgi:hypothetical protein
MPQNGNGNGVNKRRLVIWRLHLETTREMHKTFFHGRLGSQLDLVYAFGAVLASYLERKATNTAKLAAYIDMDHNTMQRKLVALERLGLIERKGRNGWVPCPKVLTTTQHVPRLTRLIKTAADQLG